MHLSLTLINGEEFEFDINSSKFIIGRSNKCDLVVSHEGISRQHLQFEISGGEIFITDLGSTNGVLVDGERIPPHVRTPYFTYLSLSFGAVSACIVELTDKTGVRTDIVPPPKVGSETRTVNLGLNEAKKIIKAPTVKEDRKSSMVKAPKINMALSPIHLLIAIALIVAIYVYMN